jgi:hypothetical protein
MSANKVIELIAAPGRIDVILRQEQDQQRTILDLGEKAAAELVARPQLIVDEDAFLEDVRPFIEIRREGRHPPMRHGRPDGYAVVCAGVTDENIEFFISRQRNPWFVCHSLNSIYQAPRGRSTVDPVVMTL